MVHAHVGGADLCARAFLTAAKLIEDGRTMRSSSNAMRAGSRLRRLRYSAASFARSDRSNALKNSINPQPRSGKQEQIENLLARLIYSDTF